MANLKCEYCRERNETVETISICESCFYTRGKWISVKDMLPDKDGDYIVATVFKYAPVHTARFKRNSNNPWSYFTPGEITHWMPLPEPPEVDND